MRCARALIHPPTRRYGISYLNTYKVWWLREASEIGQTFIPPCEKSFKRKHGRIPIDPAILATIGHCLIAKNQEK